ncbi:MAG: hypothetical protein QM803_19340 [Rhodocyclaceae bacterium]
MMNLTNAGFASRRVALALIASAAMLSACGGDDASGDLGDGGPIPDSITISSLDGPSGGTVGQPTSLKVKVVTSGNIADNEITYKWEQTEGTPTINVTQDNGAHDSQLTFYPVAPGNVTYKVTATARGKTASQSKSVPISAP